MWLYWVKAKNSVHFGQIFKLAVISRIIYHMNAEIPQISEMYMSNIKDCRLSWEMPLNVKIAPSLRDGTENVRLINLH